MIYTSVCFFFFINFVQLLRQEDSELDLLDARIRFEIIFRFGWIGANFPVDKSDGKKHIHTRGKTSTRKKKNIWV